MKCKIESLKIEDGDLQERRDHIPLSFSVAQFWNKYSPRGKGWVPRFIGKHFSETLKNCNITTKNNVKFALSPGSLDVYSAIYNDGKWDRHVFSACRDLLEKGDVFYDLGANIGIMSMKLAKEFGDDLTIYSFEPQPDLSRSIAISSKLNDFENVHVYEVMLGEEVGEAELFFGKHSVHASRIARDGKMGSIKRNICTIDMLIEQNILKPPTVIKIDIEGGEFATFKGAAHTIKTHKPKIIFENDVNSERFGYTREDILQLLKSLSDYNFFYINKPDYKLIKVNENNLLPDYTDILALPV